MIRDKKPPRRAGYLQSLLLGLLFGPLSLFYFSFWGAIAMFLLPLVSAVMIVQYFLDGEVLRLLKHQESLILWGSVYWVVCVLCMLGLTWEHKVSRPSEELVESQSPNPELSSWLHSNPGSTLNDYYRENAYKRVLIPEEAEC